MNIFYPYRVFLSSGSAFQVYREEENEVDLWESIQDLRKFDVGNGFTYFCFANSEIIEGLLDPNAIIGIDRALGTQPVDLDERERQLEEAREKTSRIRTKGGTTAIDITPRD